MTTTFQPIDMGIIRNLKNTAMRPTHSIMELNADKNLSAINVAREITVMGAIIMIVARGSK